MWVFMVLMEWKSSPAISMLDLPAEIKASTSSEETFCFCLLGLPAGVDGREVRAGAAPRLRAEGLPGPVGMPTYNTSQFGATSSVSSLPRMNPLSIPARSKSSSPQSTESFVWRSMAFTKSLPCWPKRSSWPVPPCMRSPCAPPKMSSLPPLPEVLSLPSAPTRRLPELSPRTLSANATRPAVTNASITAAASSRTLRPMPPASFASAGDALGSIDDGGVEAGARRAHPPYGLVFGPSRGLRPSRSPGSSAHRRSGSHEDGGAGRGILRRRTESSTRPRPSGYAGARVDFLFGRWAPGGFEPRMSATGVGDWRPDAGRRGLPGGLDLRDQGGVELADPVAPEAFEFFEAPLGLAHEPGDVEAQGFGLELVEAFDAAAQDAGRTAPVPVLLVVEADADLKDALVEEPHAARLLHPGVLEVLVALEELSAVELLYAPADEVREAVGEVRSGLPTRSRSPRRSSPRRRHQPRCGHPSSGSRTSPRRRG